MQARVPAPKRNRPRDRELCHRSCSTTMEIGTGQIIPCPRYWSGRRLGCDKTRKGKIPHISIFHSFLQGMLASGYEDNHFSWTPQTHFQCAELRFPSCARRPHSMPLMSLVSIWKILGLPRFAQITSLFISCVLTKRFCPNSDLFSTLY